MSKLKLGGLFSGQGGLELAGMLSGIDLAWSVEVDPNPMRVLKTRFPNARHYSNVSEMKGGSLEAVDVITFGSPCQDLSVAGKRKGMKHSLNGDEDATRSGLFFDAVRIIEEMRETTGGKYPRFAVWENVAGAYSSAKGEDFRRVLEELCQVADVNAEVPMFGKWPGNGEIIGNGYSLAWRTLDAQYFGVPQRRRRIYLLVDYQGDSAGKIMFRDEGEVFIARFKEWSKYVRIVEPMTAEELITRFNGQTYTINPCEKNEPSGRLARLENGIWTAEVPKGYFIGEKPVNMNPVILSEILQDDADPKYDLSPRACQGILRRARERGKELPEILRVALEQQARETP